MFLFVMYDISCDDDRAKFKDRLESFGFKMIQESVYSCPFNADNVTRLQDKVDSAAKAIYDQNFHTYDNSIGEFNVVSIRAKGDEFCQKIYKNNKANITTIKNLKKLKN